MGYSVSTGSFVKTLVCKAMLAFLPVSDPHPTPVQENVAHQDQPLLNN
jgi:hypothetical protein